MDKIGELISRLDQQAAEAYSKGDYNKALAFCTEAEKLSRSAGQNGMLANSLQNQGMVLKAKGDTEAALRCYEEAEGLNKSDSTAEGREAYGHCLYAQGKIYFEAEEWGKAFSKMMYAIGAFDGTGLTNLADLASEYLYESAKQTAMIFWNSNPSVAADYLTNAIIACQRLGALSPDVFPKAAGYQGSIRGLVHMQAEALARTTRLEEALAAAEIAHALAVKEGASKDAEVMKALMDQLQSDDAFPLACVHCGRTGDPSLKKPEHYFSIKMGGQYRSFAQCASCHDRFKDADYYALRYAMQSYSREQFARALIEESFPPELSLGNDIAATPITKNGSVYLFYVPQDRSSAESVRLALEGEGITCCGISEIDKAAAVIFIFSAKANESKLAEQQLKYALAKKKRVIVVFVENVSPWAMSESLSERVKDFRHVIWPDVTPEERVSLILKAVREITESNAL